VQLPLLRAGGVKAVCEHVAGDTPYFSTFAFRNIRPLHPIKFALQALDCWHAELDETPDWRLVLDAEDFGAAEREGRVAIVFGFEGAMPIDDDLGLLRMFHRLGIRSIGLTWNGRNLLGDGVAVGSGGGLTRFGRAAVAEMNRLGIALDVSHMADEGIGDTIEASAQPIIASHSNSRALCPHPRNLPDDLAVALAQRGGVVGLHMLAQFVAGSTEATLDQFLDHIDHLAALIGPEAMRGVAADGDLHAELARAHEHPGPGEEGPAGLGDEPGVVADEHIPRQAARVQPRDGDSEGDAPVSHRNQRLVIRELAGVMS
jgi:membrane dipeptidase